ncbi:MAG TPA: hypothetical protein VK285_02690 [Gaiellaceae bacterium]|nr:hypothetical protein [Gaiellaceae bacterium]
MDRLFPLGPKDPEEMQVHGPRLALSPKQARSLAELAARCSYVEIEDCGAGYKEVRSFDAEGKQIDERMILPDGGLRD